MKTERDKRLEQVDGTLELAKQLMKAQEEKQARFYEALGMTKEELNEMMETQDEIIDLDASIDKEYYVLSEEEATKDIRVELSELHKYIPVEEIRKNKISYTDKEVLLVQTPEGEYYPDYIEEKGVHLFSNRFYEYLKTKVFMGDIERNTISLIGEKGKRQEEYKLLIPDTVDCVLEGSEKYDKTGKLIYFEIDPIKVGENEIFKVKDFPHIIVANKLNRIRYSGFKCLRIENHFKYGEEQENLYKRRKNGAELENILKSFENKCKTETDSHEYLDFNRAYREREIRAKISEGLKSIYDSYIGEGYEEELSLNERIIMFFWSQDRKVIEISSAQSDEYEIDNIKLDMFNKIEEAILKMPEKYRKLALKASYELLVKILIEEHEIFRKYNNIHNSKRMRIYIKEEMSLSMVPDIIYDYKTEEQNRIESLTDYSGMEFKNLDLSNYNLSNKDLKGVKFENCNMNRINLSKSDLDECEIIKCNLTGAKFIESSMKKIKMIENDVDRAQFIGADLTESIHENNRPENHADYTKANLTGATITSERLYYNYFIRAKLKDAKLNIEKRTLGCMFIGSDMRDIVIAGKKELLACKIQESNLSNTNIIKGKISVESLENNNFTKAKLDNVDLEDICTIAKCDFKYSRFWRTSLGKMEFIENDFKFVNLSNIKEKKNIEFMENDLSYTNLSGFDFVETKYMFPNTLVYTDMSNCKFRYGSFRTSEVIFPNFKGSELKEAYFLRSQLEYVELSKLQKESIDIIEDEE